MRWQHGADKDSVLEDLKAKKDDVEKQSPEKHGRQQMHCAGKRRETFSLR